MNSHHNFALHFFVYSLLVIYNGVGGRMQRLSEEELELEKKVKLFKNPPAIKTIHTKYGDTYDCVNFYKQTAFGHPLLKNHTLYFQMEKTSLHKTLIKDRVILEVNPELKDGGCPVGTVPIHRITNKHLINENFALATSNGVIQSAVCRTKKGAKRFTGASAVLAIYNPIFKSDQQSSSARLKLQNGPDSIEAGWRVDPALYGDRKTRLYIRTDVGGSHCFNTQCPGFVITNTGLPLNSVLHQVSGDEYTYVIAISIVQDLVEGNWNLIIGPKNTQVGYWPKTIFSNSGLPNSAEWGGEVFSPNNTTRPSMGAGHFVVGSVHDDAFFAKVKVIDEMGKIVDPIELEPISNPFFYRVQDIGFVDEAFERLVLYGGPGTDK